MLKEQTQQTQHLILLRAEMIMMQHHTIQSPPKLNKDSRTEKIFTHQLTVKGESSSQKPNSQKQIFSKLFNLTIDLLMLYSTLTLKLQTMIGSACRFNHNKDHNQASQSEEKILQRINNMLKICIDFTSGTSYYRITGGDSCYRNIFSSSMEVNVQ